MSKSMGNFVTLRGACPKADDVRSYRYLVISSHYRNPLSFTEATMSAARGALKRIDRLRTKIDEALSEEDGYGSRQESRIAEEVLRHVTNFELSLADDLSMPRAAACLFGVVKVGEAEFKRAAKSLNGEDDPEPPLDRNGIRAVRSALVQMDRIFGIFYEVPKSVSDATESDDDTNDSIPDEVMDLIDKRVAAKNAKEGELADYLRNQIAELGFQVEDVKSGASIVRRSS